MTLFINQDLLGTHNQGLESGLKSDYAALGEKLERSGVRISDILDKAKAFSIAVPSWGVGTGVLVSPVFQGKASHVIFMKNSMIAR